MKNLVCFIKGHNWLYNQWPVYLGASRDCRRCGKGELAFSETVDGKLGWSQYQKGVHI